jgi:hypothetical protein
MDASQGLFSSKILGRFEFDHIHMLTNVDQPSFVGFPLGRVELLQE